jgi:hypothetical protein
LHHPVEGIGKITHFCGEMTKRDESIKAFKEIAEQSAFQRRWLPTKTWVDAIDHAKQQRLTNKMVTTAINFICERLGSKFATTKGEFAVFHAAFVVNTGLEEATCKQTVHFYYVQSTTLEDKPKVSNDICYWQQQYDNFSILQHRLMTPKMQRLIVMLMVLIRRMLRGRRNGSGVTRRQSTSTKLR